MVRLVMPRSIMIYFATSNKFNQGFDRVEDYSVEQQLELDLFSTAHQQSTQQSPSRNQEAVTTISGLRYVENYIDEHQHDWLLARN